MNRAELIRRISRRASDETFGFREMVEQWPEASIANKPFPRRSYKTYRGSTSSYTYTAVPSKGMLKIKLREIKTSDILTLIGVIKRLESYFIAKADSFHVPRLPPSLKPFSTYENRSLNTWGIFTSMLVDEFGSSVLEYADKPLLKLRVFHAEFRYRDPWERYPSENQEPLKEEEVYMIPMSTICFSCDSDEEMLAVMKRVDRIAKSLYQ